jgi:WD40 repeat protein
MLTRSLIVALSLLAGAAQAAPFVPARHAQVVAWSPDGAAVATGVSGLSDGAFPPRPHPDVRKCAVLALWDAVTGKQLWRSESFGDFTRVAFSPDGAFVAASRLFASDDGVFMPEVQVFRAEDGQRVQALKGCQAFAFSPDAKTLAVATPRKCVLYDIVGWKRGRTIEPLGGAFALRFADDAELVGICPAGDGCQLIAADAKTGEQLHAAAPQAEPFYSLAISPKDGMLATGHEGAVALWNGKTLELLGRIETGEPGFAHPFFSPDGLLAAGCQGRGDVIVWDLGQRKEVHRYTFEKGGLKTHFTRGQRERFHPERDPARYAFSPTGEAFLAGPYGGIIRLVAGGQEVRRFGE